MFFRRILVVAALTGAAASPARAAITGLTVAPAQTTPGHAVTITVAGSGPCTFDLDFGENGAKTTLSGTLPKSAQWVYLATGTKTVSAAAKAPCTGNAQSTIQVTSPLQSLCQKVSCPTAFNLPQLSHPIACEPKISSIWAVPTPGAEVFILGTCLGEPGNVKLMFPSGPVALELFNTEWYATSIHGKIPANLKGLADQKIRLKVSTHDGKAVESYPIDFIARREIRLLTGKDVEFIPDSSPQQDCSLDLWLGDGGGGPTVSCMWNNGPIDYDTDTGTDTMKIVLRNGWTTHHRTIAIHVIDGDGKLDKNDGFQAGRTDLSLKYHWTTDNAPDPIFGGWSRVWYNVSVFAEGPAGIPLK